MKQIYDIKVTAHNDNKLHVRKYDGLLMKEISFFPNTQTPKLTKNEIIASFIRSEIKQVREDYNVQIENIKAEKKNKIADLKQRMQGATKAEIQTLKEEIKMCRQDANYQIELKKSEKKEIIEQKKATIKTLLKKNRTAKPISKRSLARSRQNILTTVKNNEDHLITFVTLTFAENVTDIDEAFDVFHKFIGKVRREEKASGRELYYLAIPEFQKRGAVHFHMLWSVDVDSPIIPRREKKQVRSKGKEIEIEYYDIMFWDYGYSQAYSIIQNEFDNVGLYISKYLYKGFNDEDSERLYCRQKVLKSQNLRQPNTLSLHSKKSTVDIDADLKGITTGQYRHRGSSEFEPDFIEKEYTFASKEERDEYLYDLLNKI
ncbi:MAG: hypothetical protein IJ225_11185 [Solobacterium sp.]|nr:hypothetical protein [Solobacterium sp.]